MKKILIILFILTSVNLQAQIIKASSNYTPPPVAASGCTGQKLSNGTFDTTDDWTMIGAATTITGGVVSWNKSTWGGFTQASGDMLSIVVSGVPYTLSFDIAIAGGGNANFYVADAGDNTAYIDAADYANGHHDVNFTKTGWLGDNGISFRIHLVDSDAAFTIDNICLRPQ